MRLATLPVVTLVAGLGALGCEEPPPAPPPSAPTVVEDLGPPALDALDAPGAGRAKVAFPRWNSEHSRFDFPVQELAAKVGTSTLVVQLLLGENRETGVFLTYYGEGLAPGTYRVLPGTDEVRTEHAGKDSDVFVGTLGQGSLGQLRSESGSVVVEAVERAEGRITSLTGTLDILLRSQSNLRETTVRARFQARPDQWLQAELEHQEAIREQLRRR
jgi:hypothetical protein